MKLLLGGLLAALALAPRALRAEPGVVSRQVTELGDASNELRDAVNNGMISNEEVSRRVFDFSNIGLPKTKVNFHIVPHYWAEYDSDEMKPADAGKIMDAGRRALEHTINVPSPELGVAAARGDELFSDGRINLGALAPNQAGVYNYLSASQALGAVVLNDIFHSFGIIVPLPLLYATVIHESWHAEDQQAGRLSPKEVKKGEIDAFHREQEYLQATTHGGEEIATTWMKLDKLAKETNNPTVMRAADYVFSLLALYRTKGDQDKLKEYVDKMGYEETESPKPASAPTSS